MADPFFYQVARDSVLLQDRDSAMTKCVRRGVFNPEFLQQWFQDIAIDVSAHQRSSFLRIEDSSSRPIANVFFDDLHG